MPTVCESGQLDPKLTTAATVGLNGGDVTNHYGARGVKVTVVTTAIGTGSILVTIQAKDKASGTYTTLLAGLAITTNTTNIYTVYPGLTAAANVIASDVLPELWRVIVAVQNANPATYTVGWSTLA